MKVQRRKQSTIVATLSGLILLTIGAIPVLAQDPLPPAQDYDYQLMLEAVREATRQGLIFTPEVANKLDLKVVERSSNYATVHVWQTDVNSGGANVELEKVGKIWQVAIGLETADIQIQAVSGYRLPFPGGLHVHVSQGYHSYHPAYDFDPQRGTPVVAAKSGTVVDFRFDQEEGSCSNNDPEKHNYVIIQHGPQEYSFYAHLLKEPVPVSQGQQVLAGDLIGHVGNSGLHDPCWAGYHLHFQVQSNDNEDFGVGAVKYQVNFTEVNDPVYNWRGESQNYGLVIVGRNADFLGEVEFFHADRWPLDLALWTWPFSGVSMNDSISSIKVPPSYIVYLYADHYFSGAYKGFYDPNGVTVANFEGWQYDLSTLSLNDTVSSFYVWPRYDCLNGCIQATPPGYGGGPEPADPVPYPPSGSWDTKYWTNKFWAGDPSWVGWTSWGDYPYVYYDWGPNPPVTGWDPNNWSSRFERDAYFPGGSYNFRCQSDDGCVLIVDSTTLINKPNDGGDTTAQISLGEGYHHVRVDHEDNAADAHLYLMWWGPGYVQFDNELPDGLINYPSDGHGFDGSLYMSGDAWDNQSWVDHVTWYLWFTNPNGVADWYNLGRDETAPYDFVWDDPSIGDQTMWIRMDVVDANGNVYVSPSEKWVRVVKDTIDPWVNFANPTQGQTVKVSTNNILPIETHAGDAGIGVAEVEFLAGYWNADHTSWDWHTLGVDQDGSDGWKYDWNVSAFPDGTNFAFWVWIRDFAGNVSSATIGDVIINRLTVDEFITVRWLAVSDGEGNPKSSFTPGEAIVLTIDGYNWSNSNVETLWTWNTRNPDGSHNSALSWDNWSVTMDPDREFWFLSRQVPETTGVYTFTGKISWGDTNQYQDQTSTTFKVVAGAGEYLLYLPLILK